MWNLLQYFCYTVHFLIAVVITTVIVYFAQGAQEEDINVNGFDEDESLEEINQSRYIDEGYTVRGSIHLPINKDINDSVDLQDLQNEEDDLRNSIRRSMTKDELERQQGIKRKSTLLSSMLFEDVDDDRIFLMEQAVKMHAMQRRLNRQTTYRKEAHLLKAMLSTEVANLTHHRR